MSFHRKCTKSRTEMASIGRVLQIANDIGAYKKD